MMRFLQSVVISSSVFALSGAAMAADVARPPPVAPVVKPIVVAPPSDPFNGFYAGGHVGYGWANRNGCTDFGSFPPSCTGTNFDYDQNGWLIGAQTGVNKTMGGLLLGAEVSASLSGMTGDLTTFSNAFDGPGDWHYLGTATAKLGFLLGNSFALYALGGVAVGGFDYTSNDCSFTSNHQGYVVGAGAAMAGAGNNTWFVDYNHIAFNDKNAACTGGPTIGVITRPTVDLVKAGFNHTFK